MLTDVGTMITGTLTNFGTTALAVLGGLIAILIGLFAFRWGWKKIRGIK